MTVITKKKKKSQVIIFMQFPCSEGVGLHRGLIFDKKSHAMIWKSYCKLTESEGKAIFSIVLSVVQGAMALIFIS